MYYRICYHEVKPGQPELGYIIKFIIYYDNFTIHDQHDMFLPDIDDVMQVSRSMTWHCDVMEYKNFYHTMDKDADY